RRDAAPGDLGDPRHAHDPRARQRALPVARARRAPGRGAGGRGAGRRGGRALRVGRRHAALSGPRRFARLWGRPLLFGLLSAVGLVSGLLADGPWACVTWIGLVSVCAACSWYGLLSSKPSR